MQTSEVAENAKKALNKGNLGSRYVELFDHNDAVLQQMCENQ